METSLVSVWDRICKGRNRISRIAERPLVSGLEKWEDGELQYATDTVRTLKIRGKKDEVSPNKMTNNVRAASSRAE